MNFDGIKYKEMKESEFLKSPLSKHKLEPPVFVHFKKVEDKVRIGVFYEYVYKNEEQKDWFEKLLTNNDSVNENFYFLLHKETRRLFRSNEYESVVPFYIALTEDKEHQNTSIRIDKSDSLDSSTVLGSA